MKREMQLFSSGKYGHGPEGEQDGRELGRACPIVRSALPCLQSVARDQPRAVQTGRVDAYIILFSRVGRASPLHVEAFFPAYVSNAVLDAVVGYTSP